QDEGNVLGPVVSGGLVMETLGPSGHVVAFGEPAAVAAMPIALRASVPPSAGPSAPNPLTVVRTTPQAVTHVDVGDRSPSPEGTQAAFGPDGLLYVIDLDAVVSVLDPATGTRLRSWGGAGHGDGQFDGSHDLAVGPDGRIFIADSGNHRVQVFD